MSIRFQVKLSKEDAELPLKLIGILKTTKEDFTKKAILLLASDMDKQAKARLEEMKKYEADKQITKAEKREEAEEVQSSNDMPEDTSQQKCNPVGAGAVD